MTNEHADPASLVPSLEVRIAQHIISGGAVIPSRVARWLDENCGMTPDRRARLRDTDPEAYVALTALHLVALGAESGTNDAAAQSVTADLNTWVSTSEAATLLGITDRAVRKWCQSGRLHAVQRGSRWLVDRTTLIPRNIA